MATNERLLREIRQTLLELFERPEHVRRLVTDAGVSCARINFAQAVEAVWFDALAEVEKQGRLARLVADALDDYPAHERLQQLAAAVRGESEVVERGGEVLLRPVVHRPTFEELTTALRDLQARLPDEYDDIAPVSGEKLYANGLGRFERDEIKRGLGFVPHVAAFFSARAHDEEFVERIAARYRASYRAMRQEGADPQRIYWRLRDLSSGPDVNPLATAAVLAYFFERCDIFENVDASALPPPGGSDTILVAEAPTAPRRTDREP